MIKKIPLPKVKFSAFESKDRKYRAAVQRMEDTYIIFSAYGNYILKNGSNTARNNKLKKLRRTWKRASNHFFLVDSIIYNRPIEKL